MTDKEYNRLVQSMAPKSPIWKDCINAFWIGGLICGIAQLILNGYLALGVEKTDAFTATSMSMVVLSALLTGLYALHYFTVTPPELLPAQFLTLWR